MTDADGDADIPAAVPALAILGAAPRFKDALHVGRPNLGDRAALMRRFGDILDRRWFTNDGPMVREFEQKVAAVAGTRHAVAVCNATIGLEILFRAANLTGEVIVPSFTFVATAHALQWQEIEPVFCDVREDTHAIDPAVVESLVTPRTTGIVGVHMWGRGCDVEALADVARRRKLRLFFDAAHAFACSHGGRSIGGFGDAEVFSFHATKFCSSFEGGAIVTDDDALAEKARLMRNFGFAGKDRVIHVGSNGKMTEVCAAMGITSIEALDGLIAENRVRWERYRERLARIPGVTLASAPRGERWNHQYVIADVDASRTGLPRDALLKALEAENVLARRYFFPGVHRMEPYASSPRYRDVSLPATERLCDRVLALPTGGAVSLGEVDGVCDTIAAAVARAPEVLRRLSP